MSRAGKITFGVTCLFTLTSIVGVHYIQEMERETLHQGPIKDAKRMADKKKREAEGNTQPTQQLPFGVMKSPNDGLSPEQREKKRNYNKTDHELQQHLREKYEKVQPLSGEIVTKDGEVVKNDK